MSLRLFKKNKYVYILFMTEMDIKKLVQTNLLGIFNLALMHKIVMDRLCRYTRMYICCIYVRGNLQIFLF